MRRAPGRGAQHGIITTGDWAKKLRPKEGPECLPEMP
jgi:hypothetical protein